MSNQTDSSNILYKYNNVDALLSQVLDYHVGIIYSPSLGFPDPPLPDTLKIVCEIL